VSPRLWTPAQQDLQKTLLQSSTRQILEALKAERCRLSDLHWKQFEELVAEILRSQGMEIHLVREAPQGGRDIIARTQMVATGEVLTVAV
jgi:restriction system protein